jgi:manganese/zinc/iron transport system permease protein
MDILRDLFLDYTVRTVALGAVALGVTSGALGTYAVLRRQSLLGDAISHAALPGIALAFMLTGSKASLVLVLGAALAGWIATLLVMRIVHTTRIKYDTALGLVLSVFFGFGLVLLTFLQRQPNAAQAGLDKFLFGQAAALVERDVITIALLGLIAILLMLLFWKEFKLLSFDSDFGASLGLPMRRIDVLMTTLLVIAIVLGLQTVGVVLMSAILIAPAAAARQWTDRLGIMVALAAFFGAVSGVVGAVLSSSMTHLPTGPTIVLCAGVLVIVSMLFAPNRGLFWHAVRTTRNRRKLQIGVVLDNLYQLAVHHDNLHHPHSTAVLEAMSAGTLGVTRSLKQLAEAGWVKEIEPEIWALTEQGIEEAQRVSKRLEGGEEE